MLILFIRAILVLDRPHKSGDRKNEIQNSSLSQPQQYQARHILEEKSR